MKVAGVAIFNRIVGQVENAPCESQYTYSAARGTGAPGSGSSQAADSIIHWVWVEVAGQDVAGNVSSRASGPESI